jgi:predicted GIY-YIG superfamily endonuclease
MYIYDNETINLSKKYENEMWDIVCRVHMGGYYASHVYVWGNMNNEFKIGFTKDWISRLVGLKAATKKRNWHKKEYDLIIAFTFFGHEEKEARSAAISWEKMMHNVYRRNRFSIYGQTEWFSHSIGRPYILPDMKKVVSHFYSMVELFGVDAKVCYVNRDYGGLYNERMSCDDSKMMDKMDLRGNGWWCQMGRAAACDFLLRNNKEFADVKGVKFISPKRVTAWA